MKNQDILLVAVMLICLINGEKMYQDLETILLCNCLIRTWNLQIQEYKISDLLNFLKANVLLALNSQPSSKIQDQANVPKYHN